MHDHHHLFNSSTDCCSAVEVTISYYLRAQSSFGDRLSTLKLITTTGCFHQAAVRQGGRSQCCSRGAWGVSVHARPVCYYVHHQALDHPPGLMVPHHHAFIIDLLVCKYASIHRAKIFVSKSCSIHPHWLIPHGIMYSMLASARSRRATSSTVRTWPQDNRASVWLSIWPHIAGTFSQ